MKIIAQDGKEYDSDELAKKARDLTGEDAILYINDDFKIIVATLFFERLAFFGKYESRDDAEYLVSSFFSYKQLLRPFFKFPSVETIRNWNIKKE